jgi:hypothetical protein
LRRQLGSGEGYARSDGGWGFVVRVFDAERGPAGCSVADATALQTADAYDARCSSCYLGHPHSEAAHALQVRRWVRS